MILEKESKDRKVGIGDLKLIVLSPIYERYIYQTRVRSALATLVSD